MARRERDVVEEDLLEVPSVEGGAVVPSIVAPVETADDAWFWDGVRAGRLLFRRCASCDRLQHPPTPLCPACGSTSWATVDSRGSGRVLSWILSHHPSAPDDEPRVVVLVELDEGVRLVSNLVEVRRGTGSASHALNGARVEVRFVDHGGVVLPQFAPVGR